MTKKEISATSVGLILKRAQSWEKAGKLYQAIGQKRPKGLGSGYGVSYSGLRQKRSCTRQRTCGTE